MIRLLLLLAGIFAVWVLFRSGWEKRRKIATVIAVVILAIGGIWFEQHGEKPKANIIALDDIELCGLEVAHSYRSNFNFDFCLRNTANKGDVKRLGIRLLALACDENGGCEEIEHYDKTFPATLAAGEEKSFSQNVPFDQVSPEQSVTWQLQVLSAKAVL